jgi:large subunit ribosomal protein L4
MKLDVIKLDGGKGGSIELSDEIFGISEIRADILQRMVTWQLAKRRAGTHKIQVRNEVSRTGKKMYKQKGTGGARHGSARVPQFRGGGRAFGPVVRSHATDLPKKVRALALKHALSAKAKDGDLVVIEKAALEAAKTKGRAEIWRTGKKMYKQKGTGGARHGSARVPQFRGGGRAFGPVVRSHATDLPKKVRALALKHALSAKAKDGDLVVIEAAKLEAAKTKALMGHFSGLGLTNALIIDGAELNNGFTSAARNIPNMDVLPIQGINVYDILRRQKLVLTKAAIDALEARFK